MLGNNDKFMFDTLNMVRESDKIARASAEAFDTILDLMYNASDLCDLDRIKDEMESKRRVLTIDDEFRLKRIMRLATLAVWQKKMGRGDLI